MNLEVTNALANNFRDFQFLTSCLQEGNDSWQCGQQVFLWMEWDLLLPKIKSPASTLLHGSELKPQESVPPPHIQLQKPNVFSIRKF